MSPFGFPARGFVLTASDAGVEMSKDHVFFYGTLITGARDDAVRRLVDTYCRIVGPAWLRGRLYDLGPYPGMVKPRPGKGDAVQGVIARLMRPRLLLPALDAYEDYDPAAPGAGAYLRRRAVARLRPDDRHLPCWVYLLRRQPVRAAVIPDGDWVRRTNP